MRICILLLDACEKVGFRSEKVPHRIYPAAATEVCCGLFAGPEVDS
jgi:hypothetical protein